jgi:ubiquinone/menaquinone biosynthesis C-methylase UbiE
VSASAQSGHLPSLNHAAQDHVTRVYDRVARIYDIYDAPMEWLGGNRRRDRVLRRSRGEVLEVGIGTGSNLGRYPPGVRLTGIDVSEGMLRRARRRAQRQGAHIRLEHADVQALDFPDASFDTVTATCVFCSVADPVKGLREVARVVKPDGQVLLLEHVRPRNRLLGWLADRLSPLTRRLIGPEINRRTEENVAAAGLEVFDIRRGGIWREIAARRYADP